MTRISYRRNEWRGTFEAKCLDCGEAVEIKYSQLGTSIGRSWPHKCAGLELMGQEVKP